MHTRGAPKNCVSVSVSKDFVWGSRGYEVYQFTLCEVLQRLRRLTRVRVPEVEPVTALNTKTCFRSHLPDTSGSEAHLHVENGRNDVYPLSKHLFHTETYPVVISQTNPHSCTPRAKHRKSSWISGSEIHLREDKKNCTNTSKTNGCSCRHCRTTSQPWSASPSPECVAMHVRVPKKTRT